MQEPWLELTASTRLETQPITSPESLESLDLELPFPARLLHLEQATAA